MKKGINEFRNDLENYYGTAAFSGMPAAFMDVLNVHRASDDELFIMAKQNGFDISEYYDDDD